MPRKSESERRIARFEAAARNVRVCGHLRVQRRETFMDTGECVALLVENGSMGASQREVLAMLYPEAARALGQALIKLANECRRNERVPSTTVQTYLVEAPKPLPKQDGTQLVLPTLTRAQK